MPPETTDAMNRMVQQAERAGSIIHRLKYFLRSGKVVKNPLKIHEMINASLSLLQAKIKISNVKVDVSLCADSLWILGDDVQIQQVLLNIVSNAVEAVQDCLNEKLISISTVSEENNVIISIFNSGLAILESDIKQISPPFFTTKKSGMGMGLSIVKSIV